MIMLNGFTNRQLKLGYLILQKLYRKCRHSRNPSRSDVRKIRGKKPAASSCRTEHPASRHLVRSELKAIAPRRTDTTKGTV